MITLSRLSIVFVVAAFSPSLSSAQSLSARLTTSLYVLERADSTDQESTHARGYQAFQLSLAKNNISIHTYGQVDGDFNTQLAGDAKLRMYNLYLEWQNRASWGGIRVGRQPIFAGVAVGTVDGAQVKLRLARWLRIKGFGGGLLPADQEFGFIDDVDVNYMVGGQAVILPASEARVSLSFLNKRQSREGFNTLRADSIGSVFTQFVNPSDRALQLASIDASWAIHPKTSLRGRGDYDFYGQRVTRGEVSLRSDLSPKFAVIGGYTYRFPRLPWNSIFSVFNVEENHEVEAEIYYRHTPSLRFYGSGAGIFYSDDESYRATAGAETNFGSVSYVHRGGFAGALDGINASAYYPLRRGRVTPMAQLSWASYKPDSDLESRESLFTGIAGVTVRPVKKFTVDGQVQVLSNRFYSSDLRFLVRLQYWIFEDFGAKR